MAHVKLYKYFSTTNGNKALKNNRRQFLAALSSSLIPYPSVANDTQGFDPEVGKRLIVGFNGTQPDDPEVKYLKKLISSDKIAGILILNRNIVNFDQLKKLITSLQAQSNELPLIVGVDQEGGRVARLGAKNGFKPWASAEYISKSGLTEAEILDYYTERAEELYEVGINLNFAPVVDLNTNPNNPIIGSLGRSFGLDANLVTKYSQLFIKAHHIFGIHCCLKHFPGHGSSETDTHKEFSDINENWSPEELIPYELLIKENLADTIMMSHVIHTEFSDQPWIPASLSKRARNHLRKVLGFNLPIISDDLQMNAISSLVDPIEASTIVSNAGSTFLIYSNYKKKHRLQNVDQIIKFVEDANLRGLLDKDVFLEETKIANDFRQSLNQN